MQDEIDGLQVGGEVEVDGSYYGSHIRPENQAKDRIDRRLAEHQTGTRRVVVAIRARKGRTLSFVTKRIDHKQAYSLDGSHTNNAESFFARLRRMVRGQHHFVSPKYLHQCATHAAWLEDHRTRSNGALCYRLIRKSLAAPVSREFKGYWQRKAASVNATHGAGV